MQSHIEIPPFQCRDGILDDIDLGLRNAIDGILKYNATDGPNDSGELGFIGNALDATFLGAFFSDRCINLILLLSGADAIAENV